jgi:hypothetical protein
MLSSDSQTTASWLSCVVYHIPKHFGWNRSGILEDIWCSHQDAVRCRPLSIIICVFCPNVIEILTHKTMQDPALEDIKDKSTFLKFFNFHKGKKIVLFIDEFDLLLQNNQPWRVFITHLGPSRYAINSSFWRTF